MSSKLSRRTLIGGGIGILIGSVGTFLLRRTSWRKSAPRVSESPQVVRLAVNLKAKLGMAGVRFGKEFLLHVESEKDLISYFDDLVSSSAAEAETLQRISHQIDEEYSSGNLVTLDGWLFALTEGRCHALIFLTRGLEVQERSS